MIPKPKNSYLGVCLLVTLLYKTLTKLLGIYIYVPFSTAAYVEHIISVASQKMYLLAQLIIIRPVRKENEVAPAASTPYKRWSKCTMKK